LARRQLSIEETDDLGVHHLVHRIAIEAFRVLRGLPGHEFQYPRAGLTVVAAIRQDEP
jgi:hypothetical protein